LSLEQRSSQLWDTLGTIYTYETNVKDYQRAIDYFQRALALNPENAMILFHLGGTFINRGSLDDGIHVLQMALTKDQSIVDAHKFLGYAFRAKTQHGQAIDELSKYLQLEPNAPDALKVSLDIENSRAQLSGPSSPKPAS
jgi:tetratricopeptide (TPR) repeat protein